MLPERPGILPFARSGFMRAASLTTR